MLLIGFIGVIVLIGILIYFLYSNAKAGAEALIQITGVTDETDDTTDPTVLEGTGEPPTIIIKDPYFNPTKIRPYVAEGDAKPKKFIYRPELLTQYIGQEKAKELVKLNLKKIKVLKPVHFLISGHRGCGKTTLAHIIKNHLGSEMIERVAGEIQNADQIADLVNEINSTEREFPILFIDEIHALKPQLCENFYPIMEDFKVAGINIKPFILIGATTEKNILMNKVAPLVDRFQVQVELEKYREKDITTILHQYHKQLFPDKSVPENTYDTISKNCKYTPRIAISLLEDNIVEPDMKKILECHKIIKDGLTDTDINVLEFLKMVGKPIGGKSISMAIGISSADYSTVYEPYLVEKQYVIRTNRGRILSEKGTKFLEEHTNEKTKKTK